VVSTPGFVSVKSSESMTKRDNMRRKTGLNFVVGLEKVNVTSDGNDSISFQADGDYKEARHPISPANKNESKNITSE
jgi:hypothetical protein